MNTAESDHTVPTTVPARVGASDPDRASRTRARDLSTCRLTVLNVREPVIAAISS
jgi:hypothetical protein